MLNLLGRSADQARLALLRRLQAVGLTVIRNQLLWHVKRLGNCPGGRMHVGLLPVTSLPFIESVIS